MACGVVTLLFVVAGSVGAKADAPTSPLDRSSS